MDCPSRLARVWTDRRCKTLAALLIIGTGALRLLYLAYQCPFDLAPDEAHYWDWSRHLDWSYYSKGPGIAWLIHLSCALFGELSVRITGTEMLAVRLPAVVCGSLLLASMYVLTVQVSGRHRLALLVVAVALTTPTLSAGSTLITIDAPYACCWGLALMFVHRAVFQRSAAAWWFAGVLLALGILFKFTMAMWLPALACFLLVSPTYRVLLRSRGFWILCGLGSLSSLPILVWNAQHDWVTFHHVSGLAGLRQDEPRIYWLGPLQFLGVQCGLWLVFWFVVWVRAMWANAPWQRPEDMRVDTARAGMQFLWWMSAPMFAVFFLFAFKTGGGEPNWPITAYISGLVLGIIWMTENLRAATGWYRRLALGGLTTALAAGIWLVIAVHFSGWFHPLLEPLAGPASAEQPFPLRRLDPTLRLRGWRELAAGVDEVRRELHGRHEETIVATCGWSIPGLLGFYCQDHPIVYSLGPAFGDRRSQYDFWRPNPISDPELFAGRTFIIASPSPIDLDREFASVEIRRVTLHLESGKPLGEWVIQICRGFRGFASDKDPSRNQRF